MGLLLLLLVACRDGDLFGTCKDRCKPDCGSCEDGGSLIVQRDGKEVVLEVQKEGLGVINLEGESDEDWQSSC